jgi:hypothetical protein
MIFLFVLTIHIPGLLAPPHDKIFLTLLLRDLTLRAGALAFAASQTGTARAPLASFQSFRPKLITIARFVIAVSIAVFGVDLFLYPTFASGIPHDGPVIVTMPAWIPGHVFWVSQAQSSLAAPSAG